jgi:hypothetical protein
MVRLSVQLILINAGKKESCYEKTTNSVGKAKGGKLTEEMIVCDMATMMRQLGLMNQ